MPETRRTRAYLTSTSFANNTTGAITAQMIREFVESSMGGYAAIYNVGADSTPATQAVSNGSTDQLTWDNGTTGGNGTEDTDGSTYGANADAANNQITLIDNGVYVVNFNISFEDNTAAAEWTFNIATSADGGAASATNYKALVDVRATGDPYHVSLSGVVSTSHSTDTDILINISHSAGVSHTLQLLYASLMVQRVG